MYKTVFLILFLPIIAKSQSKSLNEVVDQYITLYQERNDWEGFLDLFADSMSMEDITLPFVCPDKATFRQFYDWPNSNFQKINETDSTFHLEDLILGDHSAVIKGIFTPFIWKEKRQEWAGGFTIWLYFNEDLKIIKQYDYVKYPAWILEWMESQPKE